MIPGPNYSRLVHLEVISIRNNQLSGDIPWVALCEMKCLRELWLSGNRLTSRLDCAADYLSQMRSLTHLDISCNYISGFIPQEVRLLTSLHVLALSDNQITGYQIISYTCI